ncbi:MAG: hypothetical protein IJA10_14785 [Lachnospiraceae bacterium]|nr:hypothetical protein [Lachnospiraceae bacterium]
MEKFTDNELEMTILPPAKKIDSLAGENYYAHIDEINREIDDIRRKNAEAYQKASLFSVG